jgi:hypothetical protein
MEIKYTVKIKDKHNPPVFDVSLGKGVLATQIVDFKTIQTEQQAQSPMFQIKVFDVAKELLEDWVEVKFEVVKKVETKKL